MARVRTAVSSRKRKHRVLKAAKGQWGDRSKRYQQAKRSLFKSLHYAYRDRRVKKREMRYLWTARINAACRQVGMTYSRFIKGLNAAKVVIDRKLLAELAVSSPAAFNKLVQLAKETNAIKVTPAKKTVKSVK